MKMFQVFRISPLYAFSLVTTLAVGVGGTVGFWLGLDGILRPRFTYTDPASLVRIEAIRPGAPYPMPIDSFHFRAAREASKTLGEVGGATSRELNVVLNGEPFGTPVDFVTANYLSILGVPVRAGRIFDRADEADGLTNVCILGSAFVAQHLGGDLGIVGKSIVVGGQSYTVLGVLDDFAPAPFTAGGIYIPADAKIAASPYTVWAGIARLQKGVAPAQAEAELRGLKVSVGSRMAALVSANQPVITLMGKGASFPEAARILMIARTSEAAVLCLLGIAGITVLNLLFVRAVSTDTNRTIRLALGATSHLAWRPFYYEVAGLLTIAGIAATPVAFAVFKSLRAVIASTGGAWESTIGLVGYISVVCASLVFGLGGICTLCCRLAEGGRVLDRAALMGAGGARDLPPKFKRVRNAIIALQAAVTIFLVFGSLVMAATVRELESVEIGVSPHNKLSVLVTMPPSGPNNRDKYQARIGAIVRSLKAIDGVNEVGVSTAVLPVYFFATSVTVAARGAEAPVSADVVGVTDSYLDVVGVKVVRGEGLSDRNRSQSVALVNEAFLKALPAGSEFFGMTVDVGNMKKLEVAGVVSNVRTARTEAKPTIYVRIADLAPNTYYIVLSVARNTTGEIAKDLKRAIFRVEPSAAVMSVASLQSEIERQVYFERSLGKFFQFLAIGAGFLLMFGVYAITAFGVSRRAREFAVRMALGLAPAGLQWFVVKETMLTAVVGILVGIGGVIWGAILLDKIIVTPHYAFLSATLLSAACCAALTALAAWIPAKRADAIPISELLRSD